MHKAILTIAALGLAAGPLFVAAPALAAGNDTVTINNFAFTTPSSVAPGATVTVVNKDSAAHTVTADSGRRFDDQATGGSTTSFRAPTEPGRYAFHCDIHSNMHGVLIVRSAASTKSSSGSTSSSGSSSSGSSSSGSSSMTMSGGGSSSQMTAMPTGGVATGGGTVAGGQDEALLLAGSVTAAAGVALGVVVVARRRRDGRTEA